MDCGSCAEAGACAAVRRATGSITASSRPSSAGRTVLPAGRSASCMDCGSCAEAGACAAVRRAAGSITAGSDMFARTFCTEGSPRNSAVSGCSSGVAAAPVSSFGTTVASVCTAGSAYPYISGEGGYSSINRLSRSSCHAPNSAQSCPAGCHASCVGRGGRDSFGMAAPSTCTVASSRISSASASSMGIISPVSGSSR